MKVEFILTGRAGSGVKENVKAMEMDNAQIMVLSQCQEILFPEKTGAFAKVICRAQITRKVLDICQGEPLLKIYLQEAGPQA